MKTAIILCQLVVATILITQFSGCGDDDSSGPGTAIKDVDGNVYTSVNIGSQVWMVENLKVTRFRNGDPIPNVQNDQAWADLSTSGYCDMLNIPANSAEFGRLYNWFAINDQRGLTPEGWRIPTETDWTQLFDFLGGSQVASGKMKDTGSEHWCEPNMGATNESGFTAFPGGVRTTEFFIEGCDWGLWWAHTEFDSERGVNIILFNSNEEVNVVNNDKRFGMSIRCIKE